MPNQYRPVAVYKVELVNHQRIQTEKLYEGDFHCFSQESDNDGMWPIALVEKSDGTVAIVGAEEIKFLDKSAFQK